MKRTLLLIIISFVVLTLTAGAQTMIRFIDLPPAGIPQAIPENYGGLHWSGIDYISTMMWDYSNGNLEYGDGFMIGPEALVAFVGGPMCYKKHGGTTIANVCQASISTGIGGRLLRFHPDYMIGSLGWNSDGAESIVVDAYNNGILVASQKFDLKANAQRFKLVFPTAWGAITQLVIHPSPGGSFVLYLLQLK